MTDVSEAYISRDGSDNEGGFDRELIYYTFNQTDEGTAATAAIAASPATYEGIPRVGATRKQITDSVYEIRVQYKLDAQQTGVSDPATSSFDVTLGFNLVGGTEHITTALATTSYATGTVVDIKKTIGIDLKTGQVRGVDIFAPVMDYSYTTRLPYSAVDNTYLDTLYDLVGTTNNATFYGRPAGEVLFKGARGSKRGSERWEISFEFARQRNQTGLSFGAITGVAKKGWEYLEVMYEDGTDLIGGKRIQIPAQVNVHQVYPEDDFAGLKIGTS